MDDGVADLREGRHQPILHVVRDLVGGIEPGVGGHPDVQVEEDEVARAARGRHYRELYRELRDIMVTSNA